MEDKRTRRLREILRILSNAEDVPDVVIDMIYSILINA